MNALEAIESHVDDLMRLKYYAAREIWPIRFQTTPGSLRSKGKEKNRTWKDWFAEMYHEDLDEYVARAQRDQIGDRVRLYEANLRERRQSA